jgi:tetratricopeptide (TPR) repeat protein
VPRAALEHLFTENGRLNEINMTALLDDELAALIEWQENPLPVAQNSGDEAQKNLYALHPIICDNQFFTENRDGAAVESAADACLNRGYQANEKYRYQHGFDLNDCAAALYQILVDGGRAELANDLAAALMNKAVALRSLGRGVEALEFYDRAIGIRDELVQAGRAELANDLAAALMNKAVALYSLGRGVEALAFYDRAIVIRDELVQAGRAELANDLATALANRAVAWETAEEWDKSLADYAAAIGWRAALVEQAGRSELLPELVKNYWCRLDVLLKLERWPEAAADAWAAFALAMNAVQDEGVHPALKEATARELAQAVGLLRQLTPEQRELIYAALTPAQAATLREAVGE